jgi:hypothetical protein
MHEVRLLGPARLELIAALKSQIAFSDFCVPAGTIEFVARDGFLANSLTSFVDFPGLRDGSENKTWDDFHHAERTLST